MAWETSNLFACADCPTTYRATISIRKARLALAGVMGQIDCRKGLGMTALGIEAGVGR